jgi:hypothetical protein
VGLKSRADQVIKTLLFASAQKLHQVSIARLSWQDFTGLGVKLLQPVALWFDEHMGTT